MGMLLTNQPAPAAEVQVASLAAHASIAASATAILALMLQQDSSTSVIKLATTLQLTAETWSPMLLCCLTCKTTQALSSVELCLALIACVKCLICPKKQKKKIFRFCWQ